MIRRCPNGATHHAEGVVPSRKGEEQTQGTETSKYLEEEKTTVIAPVVASERARAQTLLVTASEGLKDCIIATEDDMNRVGNRATEGESPVKEVRGER